MSLFLFNVFVPWVFKKVGYDIFANFREKDVSEKPDKYWEIAENELPRFVKGANLKNRNLINADMYKAFLVKADFSGANLQKANLKFAKLQEASFNNADLTGAKNLTIKQLSKVKTLYKAKLTPELLKQVKKCCPHLLENPEIFL